MVVVLLLPLVVVVVVVNSSKDSAAGSGNTAGSSTGSAVGITPLSFSTLDACLVENFVWFDFYTYL